FRPTPGVDDGCRSQGQTMHASDCATVDTTEFLLAALEQASEAVVIIDGDLHISHFNAAAESIWGAPRAEVLGCHARALGFDALQYGDAEALTLRSDPGCRHR